MRSYEGVHQKGSWKVAVLCQRQPKVSLQIIIMFRSLLTPHMMTSCTGSLGLLSEVQGEMLS